MCDTSQSWSKSALASSGYPAPPGELVGLAQLSAEELASLARLEAACVAADGGRLKLEWPSLRARAAGVTSDFVWTDGGEVVGFVGLYQWRSIDLEMCGMVHPRWRGRGVASALYEAAAAEVAARAPQRALLIVDRRSEAGRRFATKNGGELEHSEHRMQQRREPEVRAGAPEVEVRQAERSDAPFIATCLAEAFEEEPRPFDVSDDLAAYRYVQDSRVIVPVGSSEPVGVMRVERDGGSAAIYGFAVRPSLQGRGFGRAALAAVTRELHRSGVGTISLEVLSTNDSALHLYLTSGFDAMGTEDYYSMPIGRP